MASRTGTVLGKSSAITEISVQAIASASAPSAINDAAISATSSALHGADDVHDLHLSLWENRLDSERGEGLVVEAGDLHRRRGQHPDTLRLRSHGREAFRRKPDHIEHWNITGSSTDFR